MTLITTTTLSTLAGGALEEAFQHELSQVFSNIVDPNTDEKARELTIKIKIVPNERRDRVEYGATVTAKLRPAEPVLGDLLIGRSGDRIVASEYGVKQGSLLEEEVDV